MKISSKDALNILRQYSIANDENVPRQIVSIKTFHPIDTNTVVSFCYFNNQYYLLFDEMADDDKDYALKQIRYVDPNSNIILLPNPHSNGYDSSSISFKGKDCYLFSVVSEKKRLDIELYSRYPNTSRSLWQKHIKSGHISVNGNVIKSSNHKVSNVDDISVELPEIKDYSEKELPILYIDDNVIVINKPIGVLSHSKGSISDEFTVADFFKRYTTYNLNTNRPGIVHRLDRDTSGIMIGARNTETALDFQKQFADRKTKKTYVAIVEGAPKLDVANIDLPIGRNISKPSTFIVDPSGKSAITKYEVIQKNDKYSLVKLQPHTGRTHQLRVHMRYLNNPILGDRIYGKESTRLFLHAYSLEITIPNSQRKTFTAPLPDEFKKYFSEIAL